MSSPSGASGFPGIQFSVLPFSKPVPSRIGNYEIINLSTMVPSSCAAPSQAQLALALAIVKSKPANIEIKGSSTGRQRMTIN